MSFTDKTLNCKDCRADFIFSAGEQEFFKEKHYLNLPVRCKPCKAKQKGTGRPARIEVQTICSGCGSLTSIPFKPTQGRPVFCRTCFNQAPKTSLPAQ